MFIYFKCTFINAFTNIISVNTNICGRTKIILPLTLINQNFIATKKNTIWCTDFTYLNLTNGSKRYKCTIIDLHDRSVVATLNWKEITSELAINIIKKSFAAQPSI